MLILTQKYKINAIFHDKDGQTSYFCKDDYSTF